MKPGEIEEPRPAPHDAPRYAPARELPPYRFVPGLNPHPLTHPGGHMYATERDPGSVPRLSEAGWSRNLEYLHACDLYNLAYFWEAHEAWETLWRLEEADDSISLFLQGLIQAAASHLKRHLGDREMADRLLRVALEKLDPLPSPMMGLDVRAFAAALRRYGEAPERAPWPALHLRLAPG